MLSERAKTLVELDEHCLEMLGKHFYDGAITFTINIDEGDKISWRFDSSGFDLFVNDFPVEREDEDGEIRSEYIFYARLAQLLCKAEGFIDWSKKSIWARKEEKWS